MFTLGTGTRRVVFICFGLTLIGITAACNPRQLSISATDRVYVPSAKELAEQEGRSVTDAKSEGPGSMGRPGPETAPSMAPGSGEKVSEVASGPGPLEEVRVAEPPMPPPGTPQASEPSAGSSSRSSESLPMVAQAVPPAGEGAGRGADERGSAAGKFPGISMEDVYFDYDRFAIRGDAKSLLETNAAVLKSEPKLTIVIEGHCDERGTSEYNLVLGEKRARAAKQYLQDLGIESSRVEITSLGKERPFCLEHNPACWQKNRRAHFVMP